jgi:hypothetical protein
MRPWQWIRPWENPWGMAQGHFVPSAQFGPKKKKQMIVCSSLILSISFYFVHKF